MLVIKTRGIALPQLAKKIDRVDFGHFVPLSTTLSVRELGFGTENTLKM